MRRTLLPALMTACLSAGTAFAQNTTPSTNPDGTQKHGKVPSALPQPKAEPENEQAYSSPSTYTSEDAKRVYTDADVGPVQRHFVRASRTDNLEETQRADNASLKVHEKVALDKRISIPLIHDVQNDGLNAPGGNHAMQAEIDYLNWGAVTQTQQWARRGHYFTITWKNRGPKTDFTARFEYREVKSKEIVRSLEQKMPAVSGAVRSYFAVTDDAYRAYGPIVSWRFSILRGDTVVAEAKSFIW